MSKFVNCYYCFIITSAFMCNFKYVHSQEQIPVHLNYKGKYTSDIKSYEIVIPQRVNKDGSFISHLISHHHSKRSTKELELIFYKIPIEGKEYLIELTPNRKLISPGAVVEIHKEKGEKRGLVNETEKGDKIGNIFENIDIRKLENTDCHFYGHVKGENVSTAALSTCYGLAGFIQIEKGFYTIEPVAEHDPFIEGAYPHILYKADGLENSSICDTLRDVKASLADYVIRKRREINLSTPTYIETLIVMDKSLINHHLNSDCENYILTVFNMAFNLFHDASLGLMTTLSLVRMIRVEDENDEMNLNIHADAENTLKYFQNWQYEINPGDDSHPNHHDVALLITRVNVCNSPLSCGLLGLTTIGKGCDPKLSAALCEDNGLRLGYVIAHEIGHLLGADHDLVNSTCNGTDSDGLLTVMHPHVSLTTKTWSKCSQSYIKTFFDSGMGSCFFDEPEEHYFNVQDMMPGVMYNADFQCKHLITISAVECEMGSTCESLNCFVPGYACIVTNSPPADGTRCGENMWCHNTKCLVVGERPGAVDGNWGEWSAWSDCSRTCGSGVASSVRNCDKPQPSHGGKNCIGERKRYKICAATPCETGRPSFRDVQCGEFNDWIYPEDGKIHTWKAHYLHDDNPCILYCISELKQITALRPRVVDGTMCYRGIRDICVGGTCKNLPCDLHFQSNAIEDACGVCHGDGTGCEFSGGIETLTKLHKGLTKLVTVPSGARNIKVEEMSPTSARIIVRDRDTRDIYIRGKTLGMFYVPGSQAWLGMAKKNQEALNIPGPVTKPLSIWIQRLENVTVKWSMALPAEQQRKPEFAWDFLKWGPCSAKCGPGTQKSEPSCMEEKAGLVEDSFCADLEMPPTKVRRCEVAKCEPRWMVGDWKGCDQPSGTKKERKRVVYCIKTIGEGEGESQIVQDKQCHPPKPHNREPCENRRKREDTEYGVNEDSSMYRSNTVEFGFHKKYDDYLTHFAALSVPQRKSETVPLHLLSSSHFKDYFRVLETPDYEAGSNSDINLDINLTNSTDSDSQTQNKVSPDFYRNTFSGTQSDVSHLQSKASVQKRNSLSGGDTSEINSILERREKKSKKKQAERHKKRRISRFKLDEIHGGRKLKLHKKKVKKGCNPSFVRKRFFKSFRKRGLNNGKGENYLRDKYSLASRQSRTLRDMLLFHKKKKAFIINPENLTDFIESISGNDVHVKNCYLNLINSRGALSTLEKNRLRDFQWSSLSLKKSHSNFLMDNSKLNLAKSTKCNEESIQARKCEPEPTCNMTDKRPNNKEFDGSGFRKCILDPGTIPPTVPPQPVEEPTKSDIEKWRERERQTFPNPLAVMPSLRSRFDSRKTRFKDRRLSIQDLCLEKSVKRFHPQREQNKRSIKPSYRARELDSNGFNPQAREKKKRSSHKWKKPKISKESPSNGCGSETRNYLNNLFRDSHPKMFSKQEQKQTTEKPVIDAGRLVIDKDYVDRKNIEIVFQDDGSEEKTQFDKLPQPVSRKKKLILTGQKVFDLYQALQDRRGREAFYRSENNGSNQGSVIINVKIANPGATSTESTSVTGATPPQTVSVPTPTPADCGTPSTTKKTSSWKPTESTNTEVQEKLTTAARVMEKPPTITMMDTLTSPPPTSTASSAATEATVPSTREPSCSTTVNTSSEETPCTQALGNATECPTTLPTKTDFTQLTTEDSDYEDCEIEDIITDNTETTTEYNPRKRKKNKNRKKGSFGKVKKKGIGDEYKKTEDEKDGARFVGRGKIGKLF